MTAQPARRIAVIGQGFVGLPVARAAVNAGHPVLGFDVGPPSGDDALLNDCTIFVVTVPHLLGQQQDALETPPSRSCPCS